MTKRLSLEELFKEIIEFVLRSFLTLLSMLNYASLHRELLKGSASF